MRARIVVVASAAIAVAVPATADAATRTVDAGAPPSAQRALRAYDGQVNAFFPSTTTIRVGDSVQFRPFGFHNVDIPERGGSSLPFVIPTGQKVTGAVDPAGAPWWFNGLDVVGPNPAVFGDGFGKRVTYDGSKRVQSGLPLGARVRPMTVRFTRAGTVTYVCDIHPGMKGTVRVRPRRAARPSARAHALAVRKQVARAVARARDAAAVEPDDARTVLVGSAKPGGVESMRFLPGRLTVGVGDTVTFRMSSGSREDHTATTGPGDAQDATTFLGALAASFQAPVIDPAASYPSDPPTGAAQLTATSHGNGFWNSGVMDARRQTPPPGSASVRFAEAGTYTFYCLIHPFMKGTVVVR